MSLNWQVRKFRKYLANFGFPFSIIAMYSHLRFLVLQLKVDQLDGFGPGRGGEDERDRLQQELSHSGTRANSFSFFLES